VLRHQLAELAKASATGNRLALDFHPPDDAGTQANRRQARLQRIARSGSGETVYLTADRAQATELVESTGWAVVAVEDTLTAAATLLGRGSGLPIDKINPRKSLIAAVRP
jgi:hypothetical protein